MTFRTTALLLSLVLAAPAAADVAGCLDRPLAEARECLDAYLAGEVPADADYQALARIAAERPDAARVAVDAWLEHDGSHRMVWLDPDGRLVWKRNLTLPDDRLERAARALVSAGRRELALPLAEHSVRLGRRGWLESLLAGDRDAGRPYRKPEPLGVDRWFAVAPEVEVSLLDGEPVALASARGKVVLLDFWATWCPPCVRSLPMLQEMHEVAEERGLLVVAVNAEEPDEQVRDFTARLGLTIPIGRYDEQLDREFAVRKLPTSILIDRQGRIRDRWDGYADDMAHEMAHRVEALLREGPDATLTDTVGVVTQGLDRMRGVWTKRIGFSPEGLAVTAGPEGGATMALARRRAVERLDARTSLLDRIATERPAGLLRQADLDGDGHADLLSFRRGARDFTLIDGSSGNVRTIASPAFVLDLTATDGGPGEAGRVWLSTIQGIFRVDPADGGVERVGGSGHVLSLVVAPGGEPGLVTLEPGGKLTLRRASGEPVEQRRLPFAGGSLLPGEHGIAVLPASVRAGVVGRFVPGEGRQAALATDDGQVILVDLADGSEVFRASWSGSGSLRLAGGDLDGDGLDDLVVAAGPELTLLRAPSDTRASAD